MYKSIATLVSIFLVTAVPGLAAFPALAETPAATAAQSQAVTPPTAAASPNGILSALGFGIVCSGSNTATALVQTVQQYAALGKTSDTPLQQALAAAGNYATTFTGPGVEGSPTNLPQGVLELPAGQLCAVSTPAAIPVGTKIQGNNAVLVNTGMGDALQFVDQNIPGAPNAYPDNMYGRAYDSVENLIIEGPGASASTGACVLINTAVDFYMSNVHLFGCKHGLELQEVEYSFFSNVWGAHNSIGLLGGKALQRSIENTFVGGGFERNAKNNIWLPDAIRFRFYGTSASFGAHIPVLVGPQPPPYLSTTGYQVTAPGAGCTPTITNAPGAPGVPPSNAGIASATLGIVPLVFTDATGTGAQGFAVLSGGKVLSAYGTKPGQNYSTAVSVSIPAAHCTAQPTVLATTLNDGAGESQGSGTLAAETSVGSNIFDGLDVEAEGFNPDGKTPNKPTFGYLFAFTNGENGDIIRDVSVGMGSSAPEFLQLLYTAGTQAKVEDAPGNVRNPLTGSPCYINATGSGNVSVRNLGNPVGQICDTNDQPLFAAGSLGFYNGTISGTGFTAWGSSQYSTVTSSILYGQAAPAGRAMPFNWFTDFSNGSREYADGTGQKPADLLTGRNSDLLGGAFTTLLGHTNFTTNVVGGGALAFVTEFYTTGQAAASPAVGSSGLPAGLVCTATHRWNGGGSLATVSTMTFNATATCDDSDAQQFEVYTSVGQTLGNESWAPANVTAGSLTLKGLAGTGNAFACLDAAGHLFRSPTACK